MEQKKSIVSGLSHITLIVRDLEKSATLLKHIFGAEEIYSSGKDTFSSSQEKFFIINDVWLCLMEGKPLKERDYNHIAFRVADADFAELATRVQDIGVEIKPGRSRVEGEGRSLYFYDYDDHLFELHSGSLEERLARYTQCMVSSDDILTEEDIADVEQARAEFVRGEFVQHKDINWN